MKKEFFTRDKAFYRTFFPLLAVITLQQLAALAVNLVDNLMLGRYTELALSGATLVNQLQFVLQQLVAGIGMGVSVLGSQYWGKKDISPIRRVSSVGLKFSIVMGLLFLILTNNYSGAFANLLVLSINNNTNVDFLSFLVNLLGRHCTLAGVFGEGDRGIFSLCGSACAFIIVFI